VSEPRGEARNPVELVADEQAEDGGDADQNRFADEFAHALLFSLFRVFPVGAGADFGQKRDF